MHAYADVGTHWVLVVIMASQQLGLDGGSGGNGGGIFADQVCHMRLTSSTFTSNGAGYVSVAPY